jgi:hypothetical protein
MADHVSEAGAPRSAIWRRLIEQWRKRAGLPSHAGWADSAKQCADDLDAALRACADALAPPEPGWQPIETMPQEPCLIAWSEQQSAMSLGGCRVEMIGGRREYEEIVGYGEPPATHWMSLPAPPKETR